MMSLKYIEQTLALYGRTKVKAAQTTGTTNVPVKPNLDEPLYDEEHKDQTCHTLPRNFLET